MSILDIEWNWDDALRVWGEEEAAKAREKLAEEMAIEMLSENEPVEKIIKYTKLTEEKILELMKKINTDK